MLTEQRPPIIVSTLEMLGYTMAIKHVNETKDTVKIKFLYKD